MKTKEEIRALINSTRQRVDEALSVTPTVDGQTRHALLLLAVRLECEIDVMEWVLSD